MIDPDEELAIERAAAGLILVGMLVAAGGFLISHFFGYYP